MQDSTKTWRIQRVENIYGYITNLKATLIRSIDKTVNKKRNSMVHIKDNAISSVLHSFDVVLAKCEVILTLAEANAELNKCSFEFYFDEETGKILLTNLTVWEFEMNNLSEAEALRSTDAISTEALMLLYKANIKYISIDDII